MSIEPDRDVDHHFRFNACTAFRQISSDPKPLTENSGCRFPVHVEGTIDLAAAPATLLQCGAARYVDEERLHPYCQAHCRIAYREWEERKKKPVRASQRMAHLPR